MGFFYVHHGNKGMEQIRNMSQHTKLTLEKEIFLPLHLGFELAISWSRVWCCTSTNKLSLLLLLVTCILVLRWSATTENPAILPSDFSLEGSKHVTGSLHTLEHVLFLSVESILWPSQWRGERGQPIKDQTEMADFHLNVLRSFIWFWYANSKLAAMAAMRNYTSSLSELESVTVENTILSIWAKYDWSYSVLNWPGINSQLRPSGWRALGGLSHTVCTA